MSEYQPGTVASATVLDVPGVRVSRYDSGWCRLDDPDIFYSDRNSGEGMVTDIRPLVVLDLDTLVAPETLARWLRLNGACGSVAIGNELADQIEAQTKPARIPEPGLWGVVEASSKAYPDGRRTYVRNSERRWTGLRGVYGYALWDDLIDPVLVREGVES